MSFVALRPGDTLFFRDGRPFDAGSSMQDDIASLFPPTPWTFSGAIRAALARENGWNGHSRWTANDDLGRVLGDGAKPGSLSVSGPFPMLRERDAWQVLFPLPQSVLGRITEGKFTPEALLRPGDPILCDLGEVRLPDLDRSIDCPQDLKQGESIWTDASGIASVLGCTLPMNLLPQSKLWVMEARIGLERHELGHANAHSAKEGMLYASGHCRMCEEVALGARLEGLPEGWSLSQRGTTPLGGESRMAYWEQIEDPAQQNAPSPVDSNEAILVALTPALIDPILGASLTGDASNRLVCVISDRPQVLGSWGDGPGARRALLPAGSLLYVESARFAPKPLMGLPCVSLGEQTHLGFGTFAVAPLEVA